MNVHLRFIKCIVAFSLRETFVCDSGADNYSLFITPEGSKHKTHRTHTPKYNTALRQNKHNLDMNSLCKKTSRQQT